MNLKIYRMNDCDWVAHYSEEQAVGYYIDFTGFSTDEVVDEFNEYGEVALTETMYWEVESVSKEDVEAFGLVHESESIFGDAYKVPFSWVIERHGSLYPGIIASTEY